MPPPAPRLRPRAALPLGAVLVAVVLLASACIGTSDTGQEVRGKPDRAGPAADLVRPAAARANAFGLDLARTLLPARGNTVLAPFPVYAALAMTRAGATGDTRDQLDRLLHADAGGDLDAGLNALEQALAARDGDRRNDRRKGKVQLDLVSSLWAPRGTRFTDAWLDLLARDYGQGPRVVDVVADPEGSRDAMNRWAMDGTQGHIRELVPHGDVSQYTRFSALAAAYLQAPWQREFDRTRTRPAPFTLQDGTSVDVPTMQLTSRDDVGFTEGDGYQAVDLPYLGGELSLLVVMPFRGRYADVVQSLTPERLDGIVADLAPRTLELRLPVFQFTTQDNLSDTVRGMGAPAAFSSRDADLSGVTADEALWLAQLEYQGYVSVTEEGTEASATTVRTDQEITGARRVTVDQPFVFVVRDRASGLFLLVGQVARPG